jgi:hypothetical protein
MNATEPDEDHAAQNGRAGKQPWRLGEQLVGGTPAVEGLVLTEQQKAELARLLAARDREVSTALSEPAQENGGTD